MHETGNCPLTVGCFNACNTVNRMVVLAEVTNRAPALTPLVAKCYGLRPADVFIRMDSGETKTINCSSGVQKVGPIRPAMYFLALRPRAEEFQRRGRGRRSGSLCVHGLHISRSSWGFGQHG